ncbi:autotransporter outer membrane beta-barrel domain-containing protein [Luteibacter sp. Sphag1AF]|uniref:autotransporter outer membrane beta-barrel domain-containing protein n=1 Tax=Luteibacter sp. Sphag1AF TaxID=2587031 RepID=UPI0016157CB1|nr:autotransporter outer membrane beta-barrel domain-containing protein [Luteibacter sp. Sphag1AF]
MECSHRRELAAAMCVALAFTAGAARAQTSPAEIHVSSQALVLDQAERTQHTISDRLTAITPADGGGVWAGLTDGSGDLEKRGYDKGSYNAHGLMIGADMQVGENGLVGIVVQADSSSADFDHLPGRAKAKSTGATVYGKLEGETWYATATAGGASIDADTSATRVPDVGTLTLHTNSSRTDTLGSARIESGLRGYAGHTIWMPFIALNYDRLKRDAFREEGAGDLGIQAASASYGQLTAQVGVRMSRVWSWRGGDTTWHAYALYQQIATGNALTFNASFEGTPDASFVASGVNMPRRSAWVGVGMNTEFSDHWSWYLNVDAKAARGDVQAAVASAGMRRMF